MVIRLLSLKYFKMTEPIFVTNDINCKNEHIDR